MLLSKLASLDPEFGWDRMNRDGRRIWACSIRYDAGRSGCTAEAWIGREADAISVQRARDGFLRLLQIGDFVSRDEARGVVSAVKELWRVELRIHDELSGPGHKVEPGRVAAEEVGVGNGAALVEADGLGVAHEGLDGREDCGEIVVVFDIGVWAGDVHIRGAGVPVGLGFAGEGRDPEQVV
jgi:hypothetical protein